MKQIKIYTSLFFILLFFCSGNIYSQLGRKPKNLPYADQKMYHLGFSIGMHTQDMIITNSGHTDANGQAWFSEIPSYSPGFSVGMIADRYLNEHFNVRTTPTLHFGEKKFVFKEQSTGEEYEKSLKGNYFTLPLHLKFSAQRKNNYRPYLLAGAYASMDLSSKKDDPLHFKRMDYGLEFGIGCNIYLPLFKLCPELKFSLGLTDVVNTKISDLTDTELLPYRQSVSSGKTRMISLIFNFE